MTEIVVSPPLPKWVLDTFEGKLIASWIGYGEEADGLIEFAGDTENEDDEDIILLQMNDAEVAEFAALAEEAGTPICRRIASLLRDPVGSEIVNEHLGKIDVTAMRMEAMVPSESREGVRMLEVDDLMHSLITRFPDQIPYAEITWARGGTFITPEGIEWFDKDVLLRARRQECLDKPAASPPTP